MATAMTLGFGGFVGLIGMALVGWYADSTPKAPKWMPTPNANIPGEAPSLPAIGGNNPVPPSMAPASNPIVVPAVLETDRTETENQAIEPENDTKKP